MKWNLKEIVLGDFRKDPEKWLETRENTVIINIVLSALLIGFSVGFLFIRFSYIGVGVCVCNIVNIVFLWCKVRPNLKNLRTLLTEKAVMEKNKEYLQDLAFKFPLLPIEIESTADEKDPILH